MPPSRRKTLGVVNTNRRTSMGSGAPIDGAGGGTKKPTKPRQRMSMAPRLTGTAEPLIGKSPGGSRLTPSRRKSYGGVALGGDRRQSLLPPPPPSMRADPRPISDKAFVNSCIRSLMQYLHENGYEYPVTFKMLARGPSGKDFNYIVTFLLRRVDPTFNDGTLKFEDEVALAFKALGYPFPISKTALVACGSPHTWPGLLAALSWLIDLFKCDGEDATDEEEEENDGGDGAAVGPFENRTELEIKSKKIFFEYLGTSYGAFLAGDDERMDELEYGLVDDFEKDNLAIESEIERITELNTEIVTEIDNLEKRGEDLPELEKRREDYATDIEKLHGLVDQLNEHKATLEKKVKDRTAELAKSEEDLKKVSARVDVLKEKVQSQELSVDDVRRMQSERGRVEEGINRANAARQSHNKELWESEMELNRHIEELENVVGTYNSKATELLLVPESAENAKGDKYMIEVTRNQAGAGQTALLGEVDLKEVVIPSLSRLKNDYADKTAHVRRLLLELLDTEEASEEELTEISDAIKILQSKIHKSEDILSREREEQEGALSVRLREVESLETKIASLRDPVALEEAIQKYKRQHSELTAVRQARQEENSARKQAVHDEFNRALRFCADYKEHEKLKLAEVQKYIGGKSLSCAHVESPALDAIESTDS